MIEEIQSLKTVKLKAIELLEKTFATDNVTIEDIQKAQALQDIAIKAEHQIHQINTVVEDRKRRTDLNSRRGGY